MRVYVWHDRGESKSAVATELKSLGDPQWFRGFFIFKLNTKLLRFHFVSRTFRLKIKKFYSNKSV